jgi:uncharacterized protein (TIGR02284 family)
MTQMQLIDVLNALLRTSREGEAGVRACATEVKDEPLRAMLLARAERYARAAGELHDLILAKGGTVRAGGPVDGARHRGWIGVRAAVLGRDDAAILAECERGEDAAVVQYRDALEHHLPDPVRVVVERQFAGLLEHHGEVRELRDGLLAKPRRETERAHRKPPM